MALLEVNNLSAFYGPIQALKGISFSMEEGSVTTILGANGAGKTTTLRAICGMVKTEGSVSYQGGDITAKPTEQIVSAGVAHVPEGRGTFTRVTTEENLQLGSYTRRDKQGIQEDMEKVYT
ncbi:MAG: ATP-binding cassette domain-containing protein, partial [Alphaproteobacteria bacterium]|nr:ATP-binding cassette domain-containing protein [Alphaproteobacteria bacterium]